MGKLCNFAAHHRTEHWDSPGQTFPCCKIVMKSQKMHMQGAECDLWLKTQKGGKKSMVLEQGKSFAAFFKWDKYACTCVYIYMYFYIFLAAQGNFVLFWSPDQCNRKIKCWATTQTSCVSFLCQLLLTENGISFPSVEAAATKVNVHMCGEAFVPGKITSLLLLTF